MGTATEENLIKPAPAWSLRKTEHAQAKAPAIGTKIGGERAAARIERGRQYLEMTEDARITPIMNRRFFPSE
jgi:hypothetical protein